jgi:hypothetical protein
MTDYIDMCSKIKDKKVAFVLNPDDIWERFDPSLKSLLQTDWQEVKFLDDSCDKLHNSMSNLPNNNGGIYVFIVKPNIIPDVHQYILYIGRARYNERQNLKKRCREYLTDTRPKISLMREYWGKHLYIKYLPLSDNHIIDRLENELIRTVFPPCNDKYPDKVIREALKAAF